MIVSTSRSGWMQSTLGISGSNWWTENQTSSLTTSILNKGTVGGALMPWSLVRVAMRKLPTTDALYSEIRSCLWTTRFSLKEAADASGVPLLLLTWLAVVVFLLLHRDIHVRIICDNMCVCLSVSCSWHQRKRMTSMPDSVTSSCVAAMWKAVGRPTSTLALLGEGIIPPRRRWWVWILRFWQQFMPW